MNKKFSKNITTYDIEPMFNENGVCIEIHYKVFKEVNCSLSSQMWSEINTYEIGEIELNKLNKEILALHMIYHASSKQGFDVGVQALFDIHFLLVSNNFDTQNFINLSIKHNLHSEVSIFLRIYEKYQSLYIEPYLEKDLLYFDKEYLDQCTYLILNSHATNQSVKLFRKRFVELIFNIFKKNKLDGEAFHKKSNFDHIRISFKWISKSIFRFILILWKLVVDRSFYHDNKLTIDVLKKINK